MKIAAILGVKDEADLLPHCIAHLRAIGVHDIVAIDAGSTDGSLECLRAEEAGGGLRLHHFSDRDPDAEGWGRLNVALARDSGADRVIFLDADEFWIPSSGRLADCASLQAADVLEVDRYNVAVDADGPMCSDGGIPRRAEGLWLITKPVPDFRRALEGESPPPWIRGVPVSKVAVRPDRVDSMLDGGHGAAAAHGAALLRLRADDLVIAHLPFTTLARFQRKLANIRGVFDVHDAYFGNDLAWHWRRWLALPDAAAERAEFERQVFDAQTISALRDEGALCEAAALMRGRQAAAATAPAVGTA